jgi:FixJ family two-component response regulator
VDDDQSVRRALSRLIRSVNFEMETFRTARAFLDHPLPDRPACLVLDVPWARKDIPIIFITGYGDVPMSVRAMKRGAVNFLQKPLNDQELLDRIQRALTSSRAQRADRAERMIVSSGPRAF